MAIKWKVPRWMLLFLYKMPGVNPLHKMFYVMVLWGIVLPFCIQFVCFRFCKLFFWGQALAVYRKDVCGRNMLMFFPHLIVFAVRSISNHVYVWSCLFKCSLCKRTCFDTSCIHHKTGPLLCHYRCSLLASCCSKFFLWSALPLASFCMSLCECPIRFKWSLQPDKPYGLPQRMPALAKARDYKMRRPYPLHES